MILSFEFNYISQNALLENFLEVICKDFGIVYKIGKKENVIILNVEGDEETLTNFSNYISERLPLSVFFKSTAVNVVESMELDDFIIEKCNLTLPFTPKILSQSNPLMNNEVGKETYHAKGIQYICDDEIKINANDELSFESLYNAAAKVISEGKELYINSASGSYKLGKIDENFKNNIKSDFIVIPTDLSVVERMVVIRDNEIKVMASLEKPSIKLRVNSLYSAKEILPSNRVKMKLADEFLLVKIYEKLFKAEVEFLYKIECDSCNCSDAIKIDGEFKKIPQIEVCVLENGEMLIINGDGYSAPSLKENLKKFDDIAYAQFASIVQEHNLFNQSVSCFYISKTHDDRIMHLSEKTGMLNLVHFPIIKNISDIFEEIKESKIGKKLYDSYKSAYPGILEKALHVKIKEDAPNSMYSIWGIAAVILGMADNIEDGAEKIIENAEDFGGKKGPRIDYLLLDEKNIKSDFNALRLIRSAMSFKLAGADDITLSFGILEAFGYFLSDTSDSCQSNLSSKKTLLCGSMFGVRRLSEIACTNIQTSTQICLNRELPIDN